jgi:excisionase family DNA binding protein
MGMAMANQMINQQGGILGGQGTPPVQGGGPVGAGGAPAAAPAPAASAGNGGGGAIDLMTPAQVAQILSVSESDILASLEAGDLKGKRIGTQWRITRAAVDQFLHG